MAIFDGKVVEAGRVSLSTLTPDGLEPMTSWLTGALAPEWGLDDLQQAVEAGNGVLVSDVGGEAIGAAVALVGKFENGAWFPARPEALEGGSTCTGTTSPLPAGIPSPLTERGPRSTTAGAEARLSACIPFLGIEPARRFRGLGGEAGLALERHLRLRSGVRRVLAPVPDGRGLAVYFWLRLGFRPLTTSEAPWPLVGLSPTKVAGIWMASEERA
jgi:hypothetical protein